MGLGHDLERLAALHRSGALSDTEFTAAKARVLADTERAGTDTVAGWLHALRRSRTDRWLGGVCGGLALATPWPSWLWRLVFLTLLLCGGTGLLLYGLCWILVPRESAGADLGTGALHST